METAAPLPSFAILVVEDNPADVYFIRRVLSAHGFSDNLQVLEHRQNDGVR